MSSPGDQTGPSTPTNAVTLRESRRREGKPAEGPSPGAPFGDLNPGDQIGEYQITHLLGRGGMSVVYAGINPLIGKRVAIKVLLAKWSQDAELIARFFQEARAVNQIGSDYIIDIFGFDQLPDSRHYLVMDLIDGVTLDALISEQGVLSPEVALPILLCVAHALAVTHGEGIVHRDLKPHNIMVIQGEDGSTRAKILDFGVAKLLDQQEEGGAHLTRTGASVGTPMYMSPEQIRGKGVDHRSDIYALGVLMYQMFTGQLPFFAETYIDLANLHLSQAPPHPRQLNKALPGALEALILRCLEKKPEHRPGTMEEVLELLRSLKSQLLLSSSLQSSTPVMLRGPAAEPVSSRKWLFLTGVAFLFGVLGTTLLFKYGITPAPSAPVASPGVTRAPGAEGSVPAAVRPDPVSLLVTTDREDAVVKLDDREIGKGREVARRGVAPGAHRLEISAPGARTVSHPLNLKPGAAAQFYFALAPLARPDAATPAKKKLRARPRRAALPSLPTYTQVREAYEAGKWRRALTMAERLLAKLPEHPMKFKVLFYLGAAACQLGDEQLADVVERKLFYARRGERRELQQICARLGIKI